MLSATQNPPVQLPVDRPIEGFTGAWWVAHAKPRQEKALAWDVLRVGGGYFLPMYKAKRRSRRRTWKTLLPLFPGYVFLCGTPEDRIQALATHRVANVIEVADQDRLIRELSGIQRILASGLDVDVHPALQKGSRCRIRSGPLGGLEGRIERRSGRDRFVVDVSILGQGAAVEIDADLLEATG